MIQQKEPEEQLKIYLESIAYLFLVVLEIELRALSMLGKSSTTKPYLQSQNY
jgi:hypothetical protein